MDGQNRPELWTSMAHAGRRYYGATAAERRAAGMTRHGFELSGYDEQGLEIWMGPNGYWYEQRPEPRPQETAPAR